MVEDRQKGERYDPTLIKRAIALAEEIGVARAAKVLGVPGHAVQSWVRKNRAGRFMSKSNTPEQRELMQAKKELHKLKRENEDLKKANIILKELASFFSKDHPATSLEWSLNSSNVKKQK